MLFRKLKESPFASIVILLGVLSIVYFFMKKNISSSGRIYVLSAFAVMLLAVHESRKDFHFCKIILTHPFVLFAIE